MAKCHLRKPFIDHKDTANDDQNDLNNDTFIPDSLPNATLSDYLDLYDGVAEVIRGFAKKMPDGSFYHPGITGALVI